MSPVSHCKKKTNIYSILLLGNVDSLVIWVGSLDGSQEWLAPPWRTRTMFLICHLLSECKNLRQLSRGNSWSEWPEACSSLTPCPWRGGSCLHVPLAPFQRHIRPPRLFSGLVTDLSLFGCWHTKPPFKKKKSMTEWIKSLTEMTLTLFLVYWLIKTTRSLFSKLFIVV